jgi:hypothetical protein
MYREVLMPTEKFTITGDQVVEKVKQLIHEGNIRRVRLIHDGKTIIELPLSIGAPVAVIGIMWAPVLAAIGAAAALLTECTLEVEKVEEKKK